MPSSSFGYEGGASFEPHQYDHLNPTNGHPHNQTLGNLILILINHTNHGNPIQTMWCQMNFVKGIHFHSILFPLILLIIGIPIKPHLILWDPINSIHHLIHNKNTWAYNQNFDSDSPLPNQISEWTTQSFDPWTLESYIITSSSF